MSPDEWQSFCAQVTCKMSDHVKPFVSPISKVLSDNHGKHLGSGSYVGGPHARFLITNQHVARHIESAPLTHQFLDAEEVLRCTNKFVTIEEPVDVAVSHISDNSWSQFTHSSDCIPLERFAGQHNPVENELFFLIGYSGERSSFHFGTLNSPGTPYLTQGCQMPTEYGNPKYHFALCYNTEYASQVSGPRRELPTPPGMSGSLVWNTRAVETLRSRGSWDPGLACVTGIVWGWPSSSPALLATKIEYIGIRELCQRASST